jgi:signal transduction histidine kinase
MSAWLTPIPTTVTGVALLAIVFHTVGAWCRGQSWVGGTLVAATGVVAMSLVSGSSEVGAGGEAVWLVLAWSLAALGIGRVTAGSQERLRRTQAVLDALAQGRGAALRLATARERQALASELHDTVAHAMTVVCLQAGAYRRSGGDAAATLHTIATTAATSLVELRQGLDSIEAPDRPLERLGIVALGRRVGVDVIVTGPVSAVTGPAATLAFRVVREALVNIARHAPGARAQVSLSRVGGSVVLEVVDTGGAAGPLVGGTGSGLSGLAKALASAGGRLEWGPRTTGGFRVAAELPGTSG